MILMFFATHLPKKTPKNPIEGVEPSAGEITNSFCGNLQLVLSFPNFGKMPPINLP